MSRSECDSDPINGYSWKGFTVLHSLNHILNSFGFDVLKFGTIHEKFQDNPECWNNFRITGPLRNMTFNT